MNPGRRPGVLRAAGLVAIAALAVAFTQAPRDASRGQDLTARTKGAPGAPITVFEAGDFQCPACRTFWEETLPALEREYIHTGKIRFTFLHLPLASIHPNAPAAHEFAMCAARQDQFWPVHDLLFRHQARWAPLGDPRAFLLSLADSVALDATDLKTCLESGSAMRLIQAEANSVFEAGVRTTPSFVIERTLIPGAAPIEAWRPILDSIYQEKTRRP